MLAVFVDTSAFVALVDRHDRNHAAARRCLRTLARQRRELVTSTYVVDETLTLTRMHLGHTVAVEIGQRLLETKWCRVVDVSEGVRDQAWHIFVQYDDQLFSFTDCTSFALMRAMRLDTTFTFDRSDFRTAGFSPVP
jgi:uncharacterized protein